MTKNILLFTFLILSFTVRSQIKISDSINPTRVIINEFKLNYNWGEEKILIINFSFPLKSCHYNHYENLKAGKLWWNNFYKKINLENIANRFVYSDSIKAKKIIDYQSHFPDKNNFILNNFFINTMECYGVILINEHGDYRIKKGEYLENEIVQFIRELSPK